MTIDKHVGARIRERRIMLGMTQQQLADKVGVTYQQQHKYERGINRVSAGRLFQLAQALGVQVAFFFEGIGEPVTDGRGERMTLEVARNFASIKNPLHRDAVSNLARTLAEAA